MLAEDRATRRYRLAPPVNSWWIATFPGHAIFVTTLAINLVGNGLRDWLDPRMTL